MPLLLAARGAKSAWRAAALGWVAGAAFFALLLHWIYLTCRFAGVPVPVSLLAWAALAAFEGAAWAVFAAGVYRLARLPAALRPWACAALWTALEFALARWTPRVGCDLLGYTQWRFLTLLQPASWFGPHALGFLIVATNGVLACSLSPKGERGGVRESVVLLRNAVVVVVLIAAWWLAGTISFRTAPTPHPNPGVILPQGGREYLVAIIQPNVDQYRKWDESEVVSIRSTFDRLLAQAAQAKPALIVWPETSVPGWLEDNRIWVSSWAARSGVAQLAGALTGQDGFHRNSAVLVDASGRIAGVYHKRELVPFGEYVPFRRYLERWIGILGQMGDLTPGALKQPPLETPIGPVGVTLCYEAIFPRWSRLNVQAGARVLANLTNDGWYKDTWGPLQHFYANRFRAIENRAYVIRAGNTGISAVIDPWGRVTARLDLMKEGVLYGSVPSVDPFPRRSLYSRAGDWFGWLALIAAIAALVI